MSLTYHPSCIEVPSHLSEIAGFGTTRSGRQEQRLSSDSDLALRGTGRAIVK